MIAKPLPLWLFYRCFVLLIFASVGRPMVNGPIAIICNPYLRAKQPHSDD